MENNEIRCLSDRATDKFIEKQKDRHCCYMDKALHQPVGNRMPDGHSLDSRKKEKGLRTVYCNKSATYEELLRTA